MTFPFFSPNIYSFTLWFLFAVIITRRRIMYALQVAADFSEKTYARLANRSTFRRIEFSYSHRQSIYIFSVGLSFCIDALSCRRRILCDNRLRYTLQTGNVVHVTHFCSCTLELVGNAIRALLRPSSRLRQRVKNHRPVLNEQEVVKDHKRFLRRFPRKKFSPLALCLSLNIHSNGSPGNRLSSWGAAFQSLIFEIEKYIFSNEFLVSSSRFELSSVPSFSLPHDGPLPNVSRWYAWLLEPSFLSLDPRWETMTPFNIFAGPSDDWCDYISYPNA